MFFFFSIVKLLSLRAMEKKSYENDVVSFFAVFKKSLKICIAKMKQIYLFLEKVRSMKMTLI